MARSGTKIEMIGSEADLKRGPGSMISEDFAGGQVQFTGSEAMLHRRTDPQGDFSGAYSKNVRGGKVEMIGSESDLNRNPHPGWDSYPTPISQNSTGSMDRASNYPRPGSKTGR